MSGIHHCEEHGFTDQEICPRCDKSVEQLLTHDQRRSLSKFMSWALRHEPENAGIQVDEHGWTSIEDLVSAAKDQNPFANKRSLLGIVALDEKGRYETSDGDIRAVYAHSFPVTIDSNTGDVPDTLLHGTAERNVKSILEEGLKPMGREKVHLTPDEAEAKSIGERHGEVSLLEIDAEQLQKDGQEIEKRSDVIYTTDEISPKYIKEL